MAKENDIKALELRIDKAMEEIQEKSKTPVETGVATMLNLLKGMDEPAYNVKLELYKPISKKYFDEYKLTPEYQKKQADAAKKKAEIDKLNDEYVIRGGRGSSPLGDDEVASGPRNHAAKELKAKKVPKVKLPKAQKSQNEKGDRDRTGLVFEGESYGKGPLVLAVIRKHVADNPNITFDLLKKAFPDDLLKGYGIFQSYDKAMDISKVRKRYFLNDNQLVRLRDKNIAICNQFSSDNIKPFLAHARKLGYVIN